MGWAVKRFEQAIRGWLYGEVYALLMIYLWKSRHISQVFRYSARRSILGHVQVVQLARRL